MSQFERRRPRRTFRIRVGAIAIGYGLLASLTACTDMPRDSHAQGVVWQVDNATAKPAGNWDLLGVSQLLVQWTAVDDTAFIPAAGVVPAANMPDWASIGQQPWARDVVLGLAGYADERRARANVDKLVHDSRQLAQVSLPLHVTGYYFPVEIDPTWSDAPKLAGLLRTLPRPLWVSVYDSSNIGGTTLADWLGSWLPDDVGVFFQDGCGVYARGPHIAREYLDALSQRFGRDRVRVIAEAFRPSEHGGFRAATADELREQLAVYRGYRTYLFDGPHYVSDDLVATLAPRAARRRGASR
jgi:hypothetical protein